MIDDRDIERVARAIHRTWARSTIKRSGEDDDVAHERRWQELPDRTRAEFTDLARAAIEAF